MTAAEIISPEDAAAYVRATVKRSGTSFGTGMAILPRKRRDAMHAIYAFCREVDDIADDDGLSREERRRRLDDWRAEIDRLFEGRPQTATGVALLEPVQAFGLPRQEFLMMIEGMEMDADGPIIAPSMDVLLAYTRRVAGSVGLLSMPVFGAPKGESSDRFALALGDALQLTNVLRDVAEDAAIGRLYLPRELLVTHGAPLSPEAARSPQISLVKRDLAQTAKARFAQARAALSALDWRVVRPALLMMGVYESYLKRLEAGDWRATAEKVSLTALEKLAICARYGLFPPLSKAP